MAARVLRLGGKGDIYLMDSMGGARGASLRGGKGAVGYSNKGRDFWGGEIAGGIGWGKGEWRGGGGERSP
jgi:hypothetical protein